MAETKTLVCLANSSKLRGRCVAGIVESDQRGWIRPVSARPDGELSLFERQYEDGSEPSVLDVISVPLLHPQPQGFQRENWLIDTTRKWTRLGQVGWRDLLTLKQSPDALWTKGYSSNHGSNDRTPTKQAANLKDSLRLIRVSRITLRAHAPGLRFGNPQRVLRAKFRHLGSDYILPVTDPCYKNEYLAKPDDNHELGESFMTISLGLPYHDGYTYKLVAAIVERARAPR